jgi:hypothetical protein
MIAMPDLLARTEGIPLPEDAIRDPEAALEELAQRVYLDSEGDLAAHGAFIPWAELAKKDRWRWMRMVSMARHGLDAPKVLIVPVRQTVFVSIESDPAATMRMLEDAPPGLAAAFIHLEGFSRRDHC